LQGACCAIAQECSPQHSHRGRHRCTTLSADSAIDSDGFCPSGNGDSEGTFEYGNYKVEAKDIRAAVEYLRDQGLHVCALVGAHRRPWRLLVNSVSS
jgi:hypothetical protein